jgi:hypothetical protein
MVVIFKPLRRRSVDQRTLLRKAVPSWTIAKAKAQSWTKTLTMGLTMALALAFSWFGAKALAFEFQEGDILFEGLDTPQTLALVMATDSEYTHCGVVYKGQDGFYVYEAVATTSLTPLNEFLGRSKIPVIVTRLKDPAILTPEVMAKIKASGEELKDKPYDLKFQWSDDHIYCSELVYKVYQRGAGLELVPLKRFRDYNLTHPAVKALIEKRFKDFPLDELAVAPADLLKSPYLTKVAKISVKKRKKP